MIKESVLTWQHPRHWQQLLANALRDPAELLQKLQLPASLLPMALRAAEHFPLRVPAGFLARIRPGNPDDPLLRQILPLQEELQIDSEYSVDPVGDQAARVGTGILHKYQHRVLVITTPACAIHCRYCFRRHFPYSDNNPAQMHWASVVSYLSEHPEVDEVILSGGDPLSLSDARLSELVQSIQNIKHIKRLRIHSRLPIVIPERITPELIALFSNSRLQNVFVTHINHAQEIDEPVCTAVSKLKQAGIHLLNQSVLLKGVNDSVDTLVELSEALFGTGISPYYLHQLDKVQGARHFAVSDETARKLIEGVRARLPGYLVPKLVKDIPGNDAKIPL